MFKGLLLFTKYSSKKDRLIFYLLQFLILINSIFQLLSVLSVGPLVATLANYDLNNLSYMQKIINLATDLGIDLKSESLLKFFSLLVLASFIITNFLTALIYSIQQILSQKINLGISKRVIENFFYQPLDQGIKKNSYYYKSLIEKELLQVTSYVVMPLSDLNSKVFPLILILLGLVTINPYATTIVFIFLISGYYITFIIIKKRLTTNSNLISKFGIINTKIIDDLFKSFKEARVFNFEKYLIEFFLSYKKKYNDSVAINLILHNIPKHFFEIVAIIIVLSIIYLFSKISDPALSLPLLAIYITAGYKVMPSLQSILFAISSIKGSQSSLDNIFKALKKNNIKEKKNDNYEIKKIDIKKFSYAYGKNYLFKNCNISIKKNLVTGVYGESGIGKSTLVDILLGFKKLKEGQFFINNEKIDLKKIDILNHTSIVPQNIFLINKKVIENIAFKNKLTKYEYNKILIILKKLNLKNFYMENKIINKEIKEFGKNISGGQIQRLGIARAIFKKSQIVILDEFTSALDKENENLIFENLKHLFKNKIVIIISHQKNILKKCDVVYEIKNKKIINKSID
jgi:ABC-type multidrug transport system fused ATPase/permease subunit